MGGGRGGCAAAACWRSSCATALAAAVRPSGGVQCSLGRMPSTLRLPQFLLKAAARVTCRTSCSSPSPVVHVLLGAS
jgi:hypothetical protein